MINWKYPHPISKQQSFTIIGSQRFSVKDNKSKFKTGRIGNVRVGIPTPKGLPALRLERVFGKNRTIPFLGKSKLFYTTKGVPLQSIRPHLLVGTE